jgi:hypothetical protein
LPSIDYTNTFRPNRIGADNESESESDCRPCLLLAHRRPSFSPLAHAAADPHVLTQTCPNGDKIALNMNKKALAFTRGSQTYRATYDDGYAIT